MSRKLNDPVLETLSPADRARFLNMVKNLVDNADLWYSTVRAVAEDVYAEACRGVRPRAKHAFGTGSERACRGKHVSTGLPTRDL